MMARALLVGSSCLLIVAACGGKAVVDAGGGGSGGSTTSSSPSSGTGLGPAAECAVKTNEIAPFEVSFQLTNNSSSTIYVRQECVLSYAVSACIDGYKPSLAIWPDCTVDCEEDPGGCIDCGACPLSGQAITPGSHLNTDWMGKTYTFQSTSMGCQCHNMKYAPAGKYRVSVPVYVTEQQAMSSGPPSYDVDVDFDLPAPGGVVEVVLALDP